MKQEYELILKNQVIDENGPGTILKDFDVLLNFIQSNRTEVSKTNNLLPMHVLEPLNQTLSSSLEVKLKRPQQKSYPHIHGLYMLLRSTGLVTLMNSGKKPSLVPDQNALHSWNELNLTERYFNLLEAWLIRANTEIIGEGRSILDQPFRACRDFFKYHLQKKKISISEKPDLLDSLKFSPGLFNLALLERFGLIAIKCEKSAAGTPWAIEKMYRLDFGDALFALLFEEFQTWEKSNRLFNLIEMSHEGEVIPSGQWQSLFIPYFPEWQNNLKLPDVGFKKGTFIFKVSLGKSLWRRIAMPADLTLEDLSNAILEAYDFDHDHLYKFTYRNRFGSAIDVTAPYMQSRLSTDDVNIGALPLDAGAVMAYLYDFGDHWQFEVLLENINPEDPYLHAPKILDTKGISPEQYPIWGEEW